MLNNFFLRKSCRLWDNVEKYCTTGLTTNNNITQRIRLAFWITKTTNIHSEYVIGLLIALPLQQWLQERAPLLRYTYIACLVSAVIILYDRHTVFWTQICSEIWEESELTPTPDTRRHYRYAAQKQTNKQTPPFIQWQVARRCTYLCKWWIITEFKILPAYNLHNELYTDAN
jgi:hypothetical protein